MKFIPNYWRKFEFPSREKLNTMFDALVNHARKRRNLATGELVQADPGILMEHWASAIRTTGAYSDVQDALDRMEAGFYDTKLPFKTVAPESRRNTITADYYIDDTGVNSVAQLEAAINNSVYTSRGRGILFFHAGTYLFKGPVTLSNRVSFLGETGTIIQFKNDTSDNGRFVTIQSTADPMPPIVFSGLTFISNHTAIRGSGILVHNCIFIYDETDVALTDNEGIIETIDLSDTSPIPTVVSDSLFYIESEIGSGGIYSRVRKTRAVLHKNGKLLVKKSHIKPLSPNQKWFEKGIVVESGVTWTRVIDSDIRTYEEPMIVQGGNLYIDSSTFYRHAGGIDF